MVWVLAVEKQLMPILNTRRKAIRERNSKGGIVSSTMCYHLLLSATPNLHKKLGIDIMQMINPKRHVSITETT